MLEIATTKVLDVLQNLGLGKIKEWFTHDDRGVRFCLRLKLISAKPQPNFDSIYAYALAEYGDGKSKSILNFFRNKLIKELFQNGFERGDFSNFLEEAENSRQWDEFSSQPYSISFDYRKEINEFIQIFNRLSTQTRTPVEVKQDQLLEKIDQNQDVVIDTTNKILKTIQNQKTLTLDFEWFKEKFEKQILGIKDKYNTELHTQTNVDRNIHALLGDETQLKFIDKLLRETINTWEHFLRLRRSSLKKRMRTKYKPAHNLIDSVNGSTKNSLWKLDLLSSSKKRSQPSSNHNLDTLFNAMIGDFQKTLAELKLENFDSIQIPQSNNVLDELDFFISGCDKLIQNFQHNRHQKDSVELDEIGFEFGSLGDTKKIRAVAKKLIRETQSFIVQLGYLKQTNMRILGEAGIGKTHSATHVCSERIAHGLPAILLLGRQFTSDAPIEVQLRQILDVPPLYSWKDFLQVLSASASKYHTRIPIVIDGLNEATYHGAFSNIWRLGLAGFIQDIANTKNVVLITTCRATYKEIIWPDEPLESFVLASGFNEMSVEEAVKRYFAWYKIKVDTTTSLSQFENPIYLQIFCASKNPTRRNEIYIRIGQDSIFTIYDEYLKQVNRIICENLHLHPKSSFILIALTKLGGYLWTNHFRSIPINTAVEIIDESPINRLNWENSRTRAMEDEGLLVYRDWGENQEHLYFTHDVLAGYMIAHYIISQINMASRDYLNSDEVISRLFVDDQKQLHPLHEDICRCLAALLPIRTGRYLHELVNTPKSFDASVRALFEIQPEAINENAIEFIKKLFGEQENRFFLFDFLPSALGYIGHPFCATFWSQLLTPLTLIERDMSWTEYIRKNEEIFERIISHLEDACKGQDSISELIAAHLNLYAEGVMWILTSTVRPLRDKATRALYWFGRRFPEQLLKLTSLSFTINDPYISERMLAAIYGVAMARQNDLVDKSFSEKILSIFGRELFDAIFRIEAPFGTTHLLARDYALRTIQIAMLHNNNLLNEEEKQRIVPPFMDGGIREWGQSKVDGELLDEPIRMDFGNYTVGKLVRHRSNYDFKNDEYKVVLSHLYWRIFSLGYQEKIFKDVDQQIGQQNSSRHDDGNKTDRYGKKYSWIAYFELAGFRQDINPLIEVGEEKRLSDVDIDPSFPGEIPSFELIKNDFLGDRKMSGEDWIINGDKPDLSPYSIVDNLMGEAGEWVLLDGYLNQEDSDTQRKLFIFPRGFLVNKEITNELVNKATNQDLSNRRLPEIPEDYYTYAGEIPWADTYPYNGSEVLELVVDDQEEIQIEEKLDISRNGVSLSKEENLDFWSQVVSLSNKNNEDQLDNAVEKIAAEMGLEIGISPKQMTIRVPQNQEFEIQIPIRTSSWESYHGVTNPGKGGSTLSKEICEHLHLCSQPQTYDLFNESGRRASISFRFGEGLRTSQNLIYMRKDLLDKYLHETGKNLIWVIWGERSVTNNDINPSYQIFQKISKYSWDR